MDKRSDIASVKSEKARLEASGKLQWFHWGVVIASLFLTIGAWYYTSTQSDKQIKKQFEREASQAVDLISERLHKYEDTLWNGVATIASNDYVVDNARWKKYSQSLNIETTYPGINGIGIIHHVEPAELEKYLSKQRINREGLKFFPAHQRNEHFLITYIEPLDANRAAVGLDIAHEANRYEAAKKARNTGKAQITGPITLVQDASHTPGFLFYAPFYSVDTPQTVQARQESFEGMVYAPFIFHKLMEGTLKAETRHVGLTIVDAGVTLFDENSADVPDYDPDPMFEKSVLVDMYGRQWQFTIRSALSFRSANTNNKPWLILAGGFFIDALLLTLFTLLAHSNRRALSFASRMAEAHEVKASHLNNVIETAMDGLMMIALDGRIKSFNPACEEIFGYNSEDMLGESAKLIFDNSKSHETANDHDSIALLGKDIDATGLRKDGQEISLALSVSLIEIHKETFYNVIIRDITERKAEEAFKHDLIKDLKYSNEELEKFAYIASHDLKSPLRAIDNLSTWLDEDLSDDLDAENRDRIKLIRGRVNRMEGLLNSLLAYSRAGKISSDDALVSIADLVNAVGGLIHLPTGFAVVADESLAGVELTRMPLEQILNNLINNAIKHHDKEKGRVEVSAKDLGDFYEFCVADDGPGIAPDFHGKIFEMFQTLRPRDAVEGSGMGLAIVKKIIHQNGGNIQVESAPGQGSRFIFTLPKYEHQTEDSRKVR